MNNRSLVAWLLFAAAAVPAGARPRPLDERLRSVVEYWCSEPRECYAPYHELLKYKRHEVAASGDYVYVYGIVKDGESPYPGRRFIVGISDEHDGQLKRAGLSIKKGAGPSGGDSLTDEERGGAAVETDEFVSALMTAARASAQERRLARECGQLQQGRSSGEEPVVTDP